MGRDAGSREGGEGCTEPGDMPTCRASVKTSGGPKPARREGYAGIGSPAPTIPASLGPWFKFQFLHLFLHDAGQVTSLGSQNLSFLIQLNVSNKGYYLLSLYSSPEQATKSMPKTFFSPFPFLPLTIISRPLLARLHYGTPTCLHVTMQGIERALKPLPLGSKQVLPAQKDTTQAVGITLEGVTFLRDSGCFVKLWS